MRKMNILNASASTKITNVKNSMNLLIVKSFLNFQNTMIILKIKILLRMSWKIIGKNLENFLRHLRC